MNKRVGILTSGGDAPGMNATLRAFVRASLKKKIDVVGINYGYRGLIDGDMDLLNINSVGDIIHRGGTILKTGRCEEFKTDAGQEKALNVIAKNNLDAVVVIGGDGTLAGAEKLLNKGANIYHIPATIDNDLGYTDYAIGFDTAVNTVISAINNIRETGMAHDKTTVIEVMGRNCGDIALRSGLTGGADVILIPEVQASIEKLSCKILSGIKRKKKNNIIVRAEGSNLTIEDIEKEIKTTTGEDIRKVILGYLQRGGSPTAMDRMIGTLMGVRAVELIHKEIKGKAIAWTENRVSEYDIKEAIKIEREPDLELLEIVDILS